MRLLAALLWLALCVPAWAAGECPALPPRTPMPNEAMPGMQEFGFWQNAVRELDARLPKLQQASRRLVFVGDSITAGWDATLFGQFYGARAPLLLGIGGDGTQGVLARLPQEWGPMHPKLVVLLIGTNNLPYGSPENIALGIAEILRWIHRQSADTKVLVVGILPRGSPTDPARGALARVNQLIAQCADGNRVFFTDIGRTLVDANGVLSPAVSGDALHLSQVGYAIMATALEPDIKRIMGE